jgi:hypothetical protein
MILQASAAIRNSPHKPNGYNLMPSRGSAAIRSCQHVLSEQSSTKSITTNLRFKCRPTKRPEDTFVSPGTVEGI